ncbi:MAG: hypothetical protein ACREOD_00985 [Candidatus Dormibacteria bacterium]
MAFYFETSAFLKLLVREAESQAMRIWFSEERHSCWSSQLLVTEALRAGQRLGVDRLTVEEVLDTVALTLPATTTFYRAGMLGAGSCAPSTPSISPPLWS